MKAICSSHRFSSRRVVLSNNSWVGTHFSLALLVEVEDSGLNSAVEVIGIAKSLVGEEVLLEIAPGVFDSVQFRGVLRQPFDRQPRSDLQGGPRCLAAMDGTVVDDENDWSCRLARLRGIAVVEPPEQRDKVGAALGSAGRVGRTEKLTP